jgi:hypothetical protein
MGAAKRRKQLLGEKYYEGQTNLKISTVAFQCPDFFYELLREKYDKDLPKVNVVIPVMLNNNQLLLTLDCEGKTITIGTGDQSKMSDKNISERVMDKVHRFGNKMTLLIDEATNDKAVELQKQVFSLLLILLDKENLKKRPDALSQIITFIPV